MSKNVHSILKIIDFFYKLNSEKFRGSAWVSLLIEIEVQHQQEWHLPVE